MLVWGGHTVYPRALVEVGVHLASALDVNAAAILQAVAIFELFVGADTDMDAIDHAMGLHAAGDVDGVAPEVLAEFFDADDPSNHGAGVDANAQLKRVTISPLKGVSHCLHFDRHG